MPWYNRGVKASARPSAAPPALTAPGSARQGRLTPLWLALAGSLWACSKTPDPCADVSGTCVAVEVRADTAETVSRLDLQVQLGTAPPRPQSTTPPGGEATTFPLVFALSLGSAGGAVSVAVNTALSSGPWQGQGMVTLADGEHAALAITLSPAGGGAGDGGLIPDQAPVPDLMPLPAPSARQGAAMASFPGRRSAVLFGGATATGAALGDAWEYGATGWAPISGALPAGREGATLALDQKRNNLVLFGGASGASAFADTWVFSLGGAFAPVSLASMPPGRLGAAATYDPARGAVVFYGGMAADRTTILTDTWEWTGTWTQRQLAGTPKLRTPHLFNDGRAAYLVGAEDGATVQLWRLDTSTWTPMAALSGSPSGRTGEAVVYDDAAPGLVLFGGGSGLSVLGDLWTLPFSAGAPTKWGQQTISSGPVARTQAVAAGLPSKGGILLFGGRTTVLARPVVNNETWLLTALKEWRKLAP